MLHLLKLFAIAVWLQLQLASVKGQGFVPFIPKACQAQGYCDGPIPGYPEDAIESIIKASGLDNASPRIIDLSKSTRRQDPNEEKLCADVKKEIIPKAAQDVNGQWRYILNTESYKQVFIVHICRDADSACSPIIHVNTGYTASCQQQFIEQKMVALDGQGAVTENTYRLPSNCYCQVKVA